SPVDFSPPVGCTERRLKSLKSLSRSPLGMPGPWSRTQKAWEESGSSDNATCTVEPGGEYLTALLSRLSITWRILAASRVRNGETSWASKRMHVRLRADSREFR